MTKPHTKYDWLNADLLAEAFKGFDVAHYGAEQKLLTALVTVLIMHSSEAGRFCSEVSSRRLPQPLEMFTLLQAGIVLGIKMSELSAINAKGATTIQ